jgi:methionyl-tRNA formyltransferase
MGTPRYAIPVLDKLIDCGHEIAAVYTQPDKPAGRGRKLTPTPVKIHSADLGLQTVEIQRISDKDSSLKQMLSFKADAAIVAAYGIMLPSFVIDKFPLGIINLHPSLLPEFRGASPVATAILQGCKETGVTIMKIDGGMDTGPILKQKSVKIGNDEKCDTLTERLFISGSNLLVDTLDEMQTSGIEPIPQDGSKATLTERLKRQDGEIDWEQSSEQIYRAIKAFHPWPGTFTKFNGQRLKILDATMDDKDQEHLDPGKVKTNNGVRVGTARGSISLLTIQLEGKLPTNASDFASFTPNLDGSILGD